MLPMYIQNVAIVTLGTFHEELLVLIQQNFFCLLFCGMYLHIKHTAKFCRLSILVLIYRTATSFT